MDSYMIKIRIKDTNAMLAKATDSDEIARLQSSLKQWKQHFNPDPVLAPIIFNGKLIWIK